MLNIFRMIGTYIGACVLIGLWSYLNGWSFYWTFFWAFIGFIIIGVIFVLIRGKGPRYPKY